MLWHTIIKIQKAPKQKMVIDDDATFTDQDEAIGYILSNVLKRLGQEAHDRVQTHLEGKYRRRDPNYMLNWMEFGPPATSFRITEIGDR